MTMLTNIANIKLFVRGQERHFNRYLFLDELYSDVVRPESLGL